MPKVVCSNRTSRTSSVCFAELAQWSRATSTDRGNYLKFSGVQRCVDDYLLEIMVQFFEYACSGVESIEATLVRILYSALNDANAYGNANSWEHWTGGRPVA